MVTGIITCHLCQAPFECISVANMCLVELGLSWPESGRILVTEQHTLLLVYKVTVWHVHLCTVSSLNERCQAACCQLCQHQVLPNLQKW